jgi:hypothetical protein
MRKPAATCEAALRLTDIYKTLPGLTNLYRTLRPPMLKSNCCMHAIVDLTAQRGVLMNYENFKSICAKAIVAAIVTSGMFAMGTHTASAQSIIATVPFAFSAGDQPFPAGTYQFTSLSQWSLSIRNVKGGGEKFFAVHPKQDGSRSSRDGIVFHNSKGQKNLEAVYLRESNRGAELLTHAGASPKRRSPVQSAALR